MKRVYTGTLSLILGFGLMACQPAGLNQAHSPISALNPTAIQNYLFQIQGGFHIAAVDAGDAPVIAPVREQFEADLKAGRLESYQQNKHFSIQLLAGSEGNYFTSPELVQALNQRVLATLVVMLPEQKSAVFKGEFENQRFYFADPSQELALSSASKAYLLTADANFSIQTYKGEILPETKPETKPETNQVRPSEPPVTAHAFSDVELTEAEVAGEIQAEAWAVDPEESDPSFAPDPHFPQPPSLDPVSGFAYGFAYVGGPVPDNPPRYISSVGAWVGRVENAEHKGAYKYVYKYENAYIKTRIGQAALPLPPVRSNAYPLPRSPIQRQVAPPQPARARVPYRVESQIRMETRVVVPPAVIESEHGQPRP